MKSRNAYLVLFFCSLLSSPALARPDAEVTAKVIAVIDGDTLLLLPADADGRNPYFYKLRLTDIDAPEKNQPFGEDSKRGLQSLVLHQYVRVVTVASDHYGRRIGWVSLLSPSSVRGDINTELVRRGWAWVSTRARHHALLSAIQQEARNARRGLWVDDNAVPPWVWRKQTVLNVITPASASTPLPSPLRD